MRDLLFHHERKLKRASKIKSKVQPLLSQEPRRSLPCVVRSSGSLCTVYPWPCYQAYRKAHKKEKAARAEREAQIGALDRQTAQRLQLRREV